jgi:putative transposase
VILEFSALHQPAVAVGLVLRIPGNERFLRITHVFRTSVYVMWVRDAEEARYARRPLHMTLARLQELSKSAGSVWGTLSLPASLSVVPSEESARLRLESAWTLIKPLVTLFRNERMLDHNKFSSEIRKHADRTGVNFNTLKRFLLRYYYFGCRKCALLPLPSGPRPRVIAKAAPGNDSGTEATTAVAKRRGPQSILTQSLGPNTFSPNTEDIKDMRKCLRRLLKKGVTYLSAAHEEYLKCEFRRRHPDEHKAYAANLCQEPVTYRQFRYYLIGDAIIEEDLAKNLRLKLRDQGYTNAHRAIGPGEISELDATGGRIILVSKSDPPKKLGTPWIYIKVDRWSRYVPSIYVTLRHPSHEQVATAVLISITSRERFRFLHFDVNEERWPVGVPPVSILPDRGSEMTCRSFQKAVAGELRVGIINPQPYSPDAKAIVERLIRELKRRMKASRLKGVFAERPLTPDAKLEKENAAEAATDSIWELYRILLKIVDDHNNRPHKALKRNLLLKQAGIASTPRNAYVWGLDHITALRKCELPIEDVRRILLSTETASLSNGVLRYRDRVYDPANVEAAEICRRSPNRATKIVVKVDRSAPFEVFVPSQPDIWAPRGVWAHFRISQGAAAELSQVTLDEEEALAPSSKLLNATAEHDARRRRVTDEPLEAKRPRREKPKHLSRKAQNTAAALETAKLRSELNGIAGSLNSGSPKKPPISDKWKDYAEAERQRAVNETRRRLGLV